MRASETLTGLIQKIKNAVGNSHSDKLACGECDRWERCGLPPSDQCVTRAARIEAERERPPRWRFFFDRPI